MILYKIIYGYFLHSFIFHMLYVFFIYFYFYFYFYFTVFCCVKKFSNDKMFWFFFFGSPEYSHLLKPRASGNLLLHTEPGWRKRVWAHTFTVRDFPYVRTVILREKDDKLFSFCCIFLFLFPPYNYFSIVFFYTGDSVSCPRYAGWIEPQTKWSTMPCRDQ